MIDKNGTKYNELGRNPTWFRTVLELQEQELPRLLVLPWIQPTANIFDVASRLTAGTNTVAGGGAVAQLPALPAGSVLIQADPANVDNVLLGTGNGNLPLVLQPGASLEATVADLSFFFFASSGAGAVTVNWFVLQPV